MKTKIILFLILLSASVFGQTINQKTVFTKKVTFKGDTIHIIVGSDSGDIFINADTVNFKFPSCGYFKFNPALSNLSSGSTIDTTSLSNRINLKVDSAYKNSGRDSIIYTINGRRHAIKDSIGTSVDTSSLSNRINLKVDSLYKNSTHDSLVYSINGRRHALRDSVGSTDTSSLSNRINLKMDSLYKNSTKDSIIYTINSRRHAIKDSIGTTDTTSLSNRINLKVDSLYRNSTLDSIIYTINSRRHAIKDSVGSTDTTSLSRRINLKVDTVYKNSTGDSIIYSINGRRHAMRDSTGVGSTVVFTSLASFFASSASSYQIGQRIFVLDPFNITINGTTTFADAFYTEVLADGFGGAYYNAVGYLLNNGYVERGYFTSSASNVFYQIENSVFTYDEMVAALAANAFDAFMPVGTEVKIISGSTSLQGNLNYVLTKIIYDPNTFHNIIDYACELNTSTAGIVRGKYSINDNFAYWDYEQVSLVDIAAINVLVATIDPGTHFMIVDNGISQICNNTFNVDAIICQVITSISGNLFAKKALAQISLGSDNSYKYTIDCDWDANDPPTITGYVTLNFQTTQTGTNDPSILIVSGSNDIGLYLSVKRNGVGSYTYTLQNGGFDQSMIMSNKDVSFISEQSPITGSFPYLSIYRAVASQFVIDTYDLTGYVQADDLLTDTQVEIKIRLKQ